MCSIRPAVDSDVPSLAGLCAQLGYPIETSVVRHNLELLNADPHQSILVAVDAEAVRGWVGLGRRLSLESPPRAEITGLVVDAGYRGRGIGKALIVAAEDWARQQGLTVLTLKSNIRREAAHAFYRERGFTALKTQFAFSKTLEQA